MTHATQRRARIRALRDRLQGGLAAFPGHGRRVNGGSKACCTSRSPASRRRRCSSRSISTACTRRRVRRAARVRSIRRTCCSRWAWTGRPRCRACASASATRRRTPTSIGRSPSSPRSSRSWSRHDGPDVKVMVMMSGGVDSSVAAALAPGRGPRRHRRHAEALGRRERLRLLQRRRRRGRPTRRRTARTSRTTCSTSPTPSTRTSSSRTRPRTKRAAPRIRASSATAR